MLIRHAIKPASDTKDPWYQQAFVQFVLGAALLFVLDAVFYPEDEAKIIRASDAALIHFLQVTQKSFDSVAAQTKFNTLSSEEREALKQRFVESEILYREAQKLGLNEYDYVIRSRMIQKMDYLLFGSSEQGVSLPEAELRAWYETQKESYRVAAKTSFTHVFFSTEGQTLKQARQRAEKVLATLRGEGIGPELAHRFGERFYFHRDYVEESPELISSHFGEQFQQALASERLQRWSQPIASNYGVHLVYINRVQSSYLPEFEQVASVVLADYERLHRHKERQRAIAKLAEQYQVLQ